LSQRAGGPFQAVNCGALPGALVQSELFGHEKGAFTGAHERRIGRIEAANGGTLFLDEIGDMPLEAQVNLLRFLQERTIDRLGNSHAVEVDVRVIAATHIDLAQAAASGHFREDLFYRLNVVPIRLPPLRERAEDIPALMRHFFAQAGSEGLPVKTVDPAAMERLKAYRWPGNVRELENLVRRLSALYSQEVIGVDAIEAELADTPSASAAVLANGDDNLGSAAERHLRDYFAAHKGGLPPAGLYDRVLREIERPLIQLSLSATRGNQLKAAQLLGLNRNTLRKKVRELDIDVARGLK
jgi:two-component system nitrogen regulation response regulator GlnG